MLDIRIVFFGFHFEFHFVGSCSSISRGAWSWQKIDSGEKWGETERSEKAIEMLKFLDEIMTKAKVDDFCELIGKPVEVEFECNALKSWRILTEVL